MTTCILPNSGYLNWAGYLRDSRPPPKNAAYTTLLKPLLLPSLMVPSGPHPHQLTVIVDLKCSCGYQLIAEHVANKPHTHASTKAVGGHIGLVPAAAENIFQACSSQGSARQLSQAYTIAVWYTCAPQIIPLSVVDVCVVLHRARCYRQGMAVSRLS